MPAARRLKIGLSACFSHPDHARSLFTGKTLQYVEQSIAHWLMSSGAMVVMVPCPTGATQRGDVTFDHYAQWLDGLVLHGGADVWPGSYGETPLEERWSGDRLRDEYDKALVTAFEGLGKPVFGVCRGLQLLNVAFGGTLYQDVETQVPESFRHRDAASYDLNYHSVDIVQGSGLSLLYPGVERVRVNSIHHQGPGARVPGRGLQHQRRSGRGDTPARPGQKLYRRGAMAPRVSPARLGHDRRPRPAG